MSTVSRRQFLQTASIAAAGVAIADAVRATPSAPEATPMTAAIPAFAPIHQPRPLRFDPAKLAGLSEKLLRSHWENNYSGAVKALNTIKQRLAQAAADKDLPAYIYDDLKREHLARTGSVVLHELYFDNLGGNGNPDAVARKRIGAMFGDFDAWETEFRRIAAGLGGGSGWVVLGWNRHLGLLENYWLADHLHGPADTTPLLVLDMYEHAYHMDFGAAAAKYIDAFFRNIRWEEVVARIERSQSGRREQAS